MQFRCNLSVLMGVKRYSIQDVYKMTRLSRRELIVYTMIVHQE